jgi:hypothetical protein
MPLIYIERREDPLWRGRARTPARVRPVDTVPAGGRPAPEQTFAFLTGSLQDQDMRAFLAAPPVVRDIAEVPATRSTVSANASICPTRATGTSPASCDRVQLLLLAARVCLSQWQAGVDTMRYLLLGPVEVHRTAAGFRCSGRGGWHCSRTCCCTATRSSRRRS